MIKSRIIVRNVQIIHSVSISMNLAKGMRKYH